MSEEPCCICECNGDEDSNVICRDCLKKYENGELGS